ALGSGAGAQASFHPHPTRHARPWAWHPRVDHAEPRRTRRRELLSASPRAILGKLVDARAKPWHDGGEVARAGLRVRTALVSQAYPDAYGARPGDPARRRGVRERPIALR